MTIDEKLKRIEDSIYKDIDVNTKLGLLKKNTIDIMIDDEYFCTDVKGLSFDFLFNKIRLPFNMLEGYDKLLAHYIIKFIQKTDITPIIIERGLNGLVEGGYDIFRQEFLNYRLVKNISKYVIYSKYPKDLELTKQLDNDILRRVVRFVTGEICSKEK